MAQGLTKSEAHFYEALLDFRKLNAKEDSASAVLLEKTKTIDALKNDARAERKRIELLMSDGLQIAQLVASIRAQMNRVEVQLDREYESLKREWKTQIEILEQRARQAKTSDEKKQIEREIILIREKSLFLSPWVRTLSFDPSKIYRLEPRHLLDSLEARLASDYLTQALTEVKVRLDEIRKSKIQCLQVLSWQEKFITFTEEAEEQRLSQFFVSPPRITTEIGTGVVDGVKNNVGPTVKLLTQLNPKSAIGHRFATSASIATADIKDYYDLLTEVDQELDRLAKTIEKKIP